MNTRGKLATTLWMYVDRDGKIDKDNVELVIADLFEQFEIEELNWTGEISTELKV